MSPRQLALRPQAQVNIKQALTLQGRRKPGTGSPLAQKEAEAAGWGFQHEGWCQVLLVMFNLQKLLQVEVAAGHPQGDSWSLWGLSWSQEIGVPAAPGRPTPKPPILVNVGTGTPYPFKGAPHPHWAGATLPAPGPHRTPLGATPGGATGVRLSCQHVRAVPLLGPIHIVRCTCASQPRSAG